MRIDIRIVIGQGPNRLATKTIELDFAPMVGMKYDDGTWKDSGGRKIIEVTIQPDDPVSPCLSLALALEPDASEPLADLSPTYQAHKWTV